MSALRARVRAEEGVTIVVAIEILAILMLLVAAVFTSSLALRDSTVRDSNSKRALAASEAGLEAARYRLNRFATTLPKTQCLTDQGVNPIGGSGSMNCPAAISGTAAPSLGNGASYSYYVTPVITTGNFPCGGLVATPSTTKIQERCITATGTADGVTRRTQELVRRTATGSSIFQLPGLLGLKSVTIKNGPSPVAPTVVNVPIGSNGSITIGNNVQGQGGCWPGPTATVSIGNVSSCPVTRQATDYTTPLPDAVSVAGHTFANTATSNNNSLLPSSAYNPSGRTLNIGATPVVLQTGVYNLCKFAVGNSGVASVAPGANVVFFVDSPSRPGSGCSASKPYVSARNVFVTNIGAAASLQFYVYGSGTFSGNTINSCGSNDIDFGNAATVNATMYAPLSQFSPGNTLTWNGALVVCDLVVPNNLTFTWDSSAGDIEPDFSKARFGRKQPGWVECLPQPTSATDPQSGC